MQFIFRGWQVASSDPTVCLSGRYWRDRRLQLGRVRERRLLGGMLLRRGLMQQLESPSNFTDTCHQHAASHVRHEAAPVIEEERY
jgi:hypothetical protein